VEQNPAEQRVPGMAVTAQVQPRDVFILPESRDEPYIRLRDIMSYNAQCSHGQLINEGTRAGICLRRDEIRS